MTFFYRSLYYQLGWTTILYIIPCVFFAVLCHEYFKAKTAEKLGCLCDKAAYKNPLKYIYPVGFLCAAWTGYGWGKEQDVDLSKLFDWKNRSLIWNVIRYSVSGSLANILVAIVALVVQAITFICMLYASVELNGFWDSFHLAINILVWTQIFMAITQLMPLPGLLIPKLIAYGAISRNITDTKRNNSLRLVQDIIFKVHKYSKFIIILFIMSGLLYYVCELPACFVFEWLYTGMEKLVDFITGGLFTQAGW